MITEFAKWVEDCAVLNAYLPTLNDIEKKPQYINKEATHYQFKEENIYQVWNNFG